MRRQSVKAASRGGEGGQRAIQRVCGNLHQIRHIGPYQGGPDRPVRIDEAEHRPIERQLLHVTRRHILGPAGCRAIRLVVGDQNPAGRDGKPIPLTHYRYHPALTTMRPTIGTSARAVRAEQVAKAPILQHR